MTFTPEEQDDHREAFIKECRQKAWGAACNADFIGKELDTVLAEYQKIKAEDDQLAADIKELENAVDSHTVDNRQKRKAHQERRNALIEPMNLLMRNHQQGQQAMGQLLASIESNMALAGHAEGWEWKEAASQSTDHEKEGNK